MSALGPDRADSHKAPPAESGTVDQIVLLDSPAVSSFQLQFGDSRTGLDGTQQAQVWALSRQVTAQQRRFMDAARRQGISLTVRRNFTYLLNGLVVSLPANQAGELSRLEGVQGVYPDRQVHLELDQSVTLVGADQVRQMLDGQGQPVTGQGMHVAVIDTSIDYTHSDLGGCFGPGCKVVGGYDL